MVDRRIGRVVTASIIIVLILLTLPAIYGQDDTGFVVSNKVGVWESEDPVDIRSGNTEGYSEIEFLYPDAVLGSWQSNIEITLSSEGGDKVIGAFIVQVPEIGFKIEYYESLKPGSILGIGQVISNELRIYLGGEQVYYRNATATWPYDTRLNTRIYYSLWRSSEDTLSIIVQDYYGKIYENSSIYWSANVTYTGEPLNLKILVWKKSNGKSQISSYLYFNDVVENEVYTEKLEVKKLNIDMSIMFYTSIGFLIIALVSNIFSKNLMRKEETEVVEEKKPEKKRKKKK